jgi:hypothetical protein
VDVALSLAELNASLGDYDRALEHLSAADQLSNGALGWRLTDRRDSWLERVVAGPYETKRDPSSGRARGARPKGPAPVSSVG